MAVTPDASVALAVREKVQQFLNAARTGDLDGFKKIAAQLDDGKGLAKTVEDVKDANKRGALHFAAREGKIEVCKYLLEELKLDVDAKDEDGDTPLLHAARQGHTDTAIYLLERGANPATCSELGATALHHAAGIGNIELLKFLLSKGVDVESQSDAGTPLIWAAGHEQQDAVKILLEHHANPNAETDDNITPLLSAVAAGALPCIELLIQAGANANVSAGGATPLLIAADNGNSDIVNCLLKAGADPNIADEMAANSNRQWTNVPQMNKDFIDLCLNEIATRGYQGTSLKSSSWQSIREALSSKYPDIFDTVGNKQKFIKNRWKALEKKFSAYKLCMNHTGSVYNETTRLFTFDDDKWDYLKKDGVKPIQVAAARNNRVVVEILFPLTSPVQTVPEWSIDGIIEHMQSEIGKEQGTGEHNEAGQPKNSSLPKRDIPEVTPEAKKKSLEAKSRGQDAFNRKDYLMAVDAYTQAFDLDPSDATLLSNRSLCWIRLGQADHALADAKACRELRPDWHKACYREGAALRLLQKFEEAANAFYEGVQIAPENKELVDAFREAVEAGRKFHNQNQQKERKETLSQ